MNEERTYVNYTKTPEEAWNIVGKARDTIYVYGYATMADIIGIERETLSDDHDDISDHIVWTDIREQDVTVAPDYNLKEGSLYPIKLVIRGGKYYEDLNDIPVNNKDDQSIKADAGKPKLTLVPQQIIFDIARVREYGLAKYGKSESWREVDIQRYRDAAYRHFLAYLRDPQGVDEESKLTHLSHLACNIAFLCEMENDISRKGE